MALDRFGKLWFTDRARSALGVWDGRRLTELPVQRRPRPQLEDIVLGGGGSSKLWFLDLHGRIGLADPVGGGLRIYEAPGQHASPGPSRLTGSFARAAWYTTLTGVGRLSEEGDSEELVRAARGTRRTGGRPRRQPLGRGSTRAAAIPRLAQRLGHRVHARPAARRPVA